ncbi:MAG: hypothetical protein ACTSYM_09615 [Candidatus Baldrarchaeia archaeon]
MREVKIEVIGPEEDYPSYTCYLWLLETKDLIEEDLDVKVDLTISPLKVGRFLLLRFSFFGCSLPF